MDVEIDMDFEILVNNRPAGFQTLIYENFTIDWEVLNVQYEETLPVIAVKPEAPAQIEDKNTEPELLPTPQPSDELEKKSEEPKEKGGQPECPKEKEIAIEEALKYFQMIPSES